MTADSMLIDRLADAVAARTRIPIDVALWSADEIAGRLG